MSEKRIKKRSLNGRRVVIGFWSIIFLIALFLLLKNAGFLTCSCWSAFATWPLVLFIVSIFCLLKRRWISGVFFLVAAKFFWIPFWIPLFKVQYPNLLPMMPEADGFVRKYWYVLLVVFAFLMIVKHLFGKKHSYCHKHQWEHWGKPNRCKTHTLSTSEEKNGFIESNVVFNNIDRIYLNEDFTGGDFNVVFGSQTIDLRKCIIHNEEKAHFEINVVFGSCEIWVPSDWNVQFDVDGVFSSIDDYRSEKPTDDNSKNILVLTGSCVFSSLEIKN